MKQEKTLNINNLEKVIRNVTNAGGTIFTRTRLCLSSADKGVVFGTCSETCYQKSTTVASQTGLPINALKPNI